MYKHNYFRRHSEMVIIKDNKYNEKFNYYDELFKENIEFWSL